MPSDRPPGTPAGDAAPTVVLRGDGDEVEVRYIARGASTSLLVTDLQTGDAVVLDATELESLARAPGDLRDLLRDMDGGARS